MPQIAYNIKRQNLKFSKGSEIRRRIEDGTRSRVQPLVTKRLEIIVANWKHSPEFKAKEKSTANSFIIHIFPTGDGTDQWRWVSLGTKGPYPIPKAGPGYLAFQLGYQPKTKPKGQFGGPGKATGPWRRGVMQVKHPGIKPRKFEESVIEQSAPWFNKTMASIVDDAIEQA